jgi:hypothetical protein
LYVVIKRGKKGKEKKWKGTFSQGGTDGRATIKNTCHTDSRSLFLTRSCFGSRYLNIFSFSFFLSTIYVSTIFSFLFPYKLRSLELVCESTLKKLVLAAERQMEIQISRFRFLWLLP